jgi:hypothetical protein
MSTAKYLFENQQAVPPNLIFGRDRDRSQSEYLFRFAVRLFEACSVANFIAPVCRHLLDVLKQLSALPGFCLSAELRALANQVLDSIRADHIFEFNELLHLHEAVHF